VIEKYLDASATKGVVAGSAAAAAAAGGAAGGGGGAAKVGKGKDDGKIWGDYPHQTHVSWITAIYLMVMAFLKEIVFTIFSTIPIKITYKNDSISMRQKVIGVVWIVALCCAVFCEALLWFAALCCCIVLVACLEVCLSREEQLGRARPSMRAKLLDP
jgi:hypothetical protein